MKYIIIGVIVIALLAAGFWAGKKSDDTSTVTATPSKSTTPSALPLIDKGESEGDRVIGNRPGDLAPDFRLKDTQGRDISLRDYLGRETIKLEFTVANQLVFRPASAPQGITLRDPDDTVRHLYAVTPLPYTVNIDEHGIIR